MHATGSATSRRSSPQAQPAAGSGAVGFVGVIRRRQRIVREGAGGIVRRKCWRCFAAIRCCRLGVMRQDTRRRLPVLLRRRCQRHAAGSRHEVACWQWGGRQRRRRRLIRCSGRDGQRLLDAGCVGCPPRICGVGRLPGCRGRRRRRRRRRRGGVARAASVLLLRWRRQLGVDGHHAEGLADVGGPQASRPLRG